MISGAAKAGRVAALSLVVVLLVSGCGTIVDGSPMPSPLQEPLLPIERHEEMRRIGPETYLAECLPGTRQYPPGLIPSRPAGWPQEHPGFHILSDGHCAFDPTVTPNPVSAQPVGP